MTHDIESRDQIIEDLSNRLDKFEKEIVKTKPAPYTTSELREWLDTLGPINNEYEETDRADDTAKLVSNRLKKMAQREISLCDQRSNLMDENQALRILSKLQISNLEKEIERLTGELNRQECDTTFWKNRCEKMEAEVTLLRSLANPNIADSSLKIR